MGPEEVALILGKAAAFDSRNVGDGDILAWLEAIGDLDPTLCLTAVSRHYAASTDRLMPAHLRRIVTEIEHDQRKSQRLAIEAAQEPETDPRPLTDRSAEIQAFVNGIRGVLPEGDPDKLRPRAAYWRREHAIHRPRHEEPNPEFAGWAQHDRSTDDQHE